jgi:hypothetical protein
VMQWGRRLFAVVGVVLLTGACSSAERPSVQGDTVALPTPMRSFDASVSVTISQLQAAMAAVGSRLDVAAAAYRPSEPQSLLQVPRAVMRADLADPDDGYLVIYEAADAAAAGQLAQGLAAYLGSGFGQTNYPADTQFSVALLDDTVVFSSWSAGRSSDPDRAEAVFDAIASVGMEVEVRK